jgi:UDP-N-acetylmuramyl pentapeptide phosphotransferase/UDP-N-acetylglucosamine-1-phosphate transferase
VAILASISLIFHAGYVFGSLGVKDIPNERSLHTEITKKSGGMVFIPLFLLFVLVWQYLHPSVDTNSWNLRLMIYGTLFFCILGLVDDLYQLSPNVRLLLEFSFAFGWVYFLAPNLSLFGHNISNPILVVIVLGFMIVSLVNLVNFMDGLDLYLVGTIFLGSLFWIPIYSPAFLPSGDFFYALVLFFISLSGFAFFNFPRAKLFMGDSGSLAIGFILISLPLLSVQKSEVPFELIELFYLFPLFWIDGIITIAIRSYFKKHIFSAHREHLYQILTESKLGKAGTCMVVCLANLPALILYSSAKMKLITIDLKSNWLTIFTVLTYVVFYSFIRFVLFRMRKNLA